MNRFLGGSILRSALTLAVLWTTIPAATTAQEILREGSEWDVSRIDPRIAKQIDFVFRRWERVASPGAAIGIIEDGELLYARGYGYANLEHDIPITPRTVFHVASVSKQFTALAVGMLEERGHLSLDDDVRAHVPELPDLGHEITLRQLIHHTSGIRDQWTLLTLAGWRLDDVITRADILGLLSRQRELNFEPGSEYLYSNSGYMLLADIVDRTTDMSFREWTIREIFEPLGMLDTHAHDDHQMIVKHRAESYARLPGGRYRRAPLNYATVGATSLFTTVEDMARWAAALMRRDFEPAVLEQMVQPTRLNEGNELSYGFGLSLGEADGRAVIQHGGADAGFRSHFALFPDDGVAVVLLANEAQINAGQLAHRVAGIFLDSREPIDVSNEISTVEGVEEDPDVGEPTEAPIQDPADPTIAESDLEPLLGFYWSPVLDNVRRIKLEGGRLFYERGPGNATELRYMGSSVFRMGGIEPPLEVRFERSDASPPGAEAPDVMVVSPTLEPEIRFERIAAAREPVPVAEYAGVFRSEEVGVGVRILEQEGGLAIRHPRHGTFTLNPIAADRFDSRQWWLGTLRFTRDEEGRVDGFRSTSGRVRHLRFDRVDDGAPGRFQSPPLGSRPPD